MCTQPLKCYKLNKQKLQEYVEKYNLYSLEAITDNNEILERLEKDPTENAIMDLKTQAINYYTNQLYYEKEDNKYKIKRILWKREPKYYAECYDISEINCGQCQECKFKHASEWALRCELETQYHKENCFITLTYNTENLPKNRSLSMSDLQKFWKRLRKYIARQGGEEIKYFACGEYGPKTLRPHYHAIIFGWKPHDLEFHGTNYRGDKLYLSKTLAKIWGNGYVIIGENASRNTAQYVAQYVSKKIHKDFHAKHGREQEFITMSRKEGIGLRYFKEHKNKIWEDKGVWIATEKGGQLKEIPKYFNKKFKEKFENERCNFLLWNEYEERQNEKIDRMFERRGEILRNTTLTWEQYLTQHAEALKTRLKVFKRDATENSPLGT